MTAPADAAALEATLAELGRHRRVFLGSDAHVGIVPLRAACSCGLVYGKVTAQDDHTETHETHLAAALDAWFTARLGEAKAEALNEAADALTWVKPESCPCDAPEACCGSEESCDAMRPITKVVGADWLRKRARTALAAMAARVGDGGGS